LKRKIFSVLFALVLALSLAGLLAVTPVSSPFVSEAEASPGALNVKLPSQVTTDGGHYLGSFSLDGSQIVYTGAGGSIWVMNVDGTGKTRVGTVTGSRPKWAPDGRISYASGNDLKICNTDGTGEETVVTVLDWSRGDTVTTSGIHSHDWIEVEGTYKLAIASSTGCSTIYVADVDFSSIPLAEGAFTRITNGSTTAYAPAWSPDGTQVACAYGASSVTQIGVFAADGSTMDTPTLLGVAGHSDYPDWGSNNKIAYHDIATKELYVMESDGSNITKYSSGPVAMVAWSPDCSQIVYVSGFGGDVYVIDYPCFAGIQLAIDAAADNDTINVAAGTYAEHLFIEGFDGLTLQSVDGAENTIINAAQTGDGPPPPWGENCGTSPGIIVINSTDVTIDGFTIKDVILDTETGELCQYTTDPYLMNSILVYGSSDCTIENNILDNFYYGIHLCGEANFGEPYARPCNNNRILNNKLYGHDVAWLGIVLYDWNVGPQENNIITGNIIEGCYISISVGYNAANTLVKGNTITGSPDLVDYYPEYTYQEPPEELNNGIGIKLTGDGETTEGVTGHTVEANDISDCDIGVELRTFDVKITGNNVQTCRIGIGVNDDLHPVTGNELHLNNIVSNTEYGIKNLSSTPIDATNNWWGNASGPADPARHETTGYEAYGDAVSTNVDYEPWLLEEVQSGVTPTTYDKTLALKDGWTLISTDKEVTTGTTWVTPILAYKYTPSGGFMEATLADLQPVNALYVKTDGGGGVGINYPADADPVVNSKDLEAGWNLISSASSTVGTRAVLSPLRYVQVGTQQGVGLTTLVSQGNYNQFSNSFYLATLTDADWTALDDVTLEPFDGYWAYMNAAKTFSVIPD